MVTDEHALDAATVVGTPPVADPTYAVTSGGDATDPGDGVLTLREAIAEAKGASAPRSPSPPGSTPSRWRKASC